MPTETGLHPLAALDEILRLHPKTDHHLFSVCTQGLCKARDAMIARDERGGRLEQMNAVISVIMAGQFPIGKIEWGELQKARDWLESLVEV